MSIGPRLPRQSAENCECGGLYIFDSNWDDHSIWKCGQCGSTQRSVRVGHRNEVIKTQDIMDETIIAETPYSEKTDEKD